MAVHENRLVSTLITEEHYASAIEVTGRGWVAEDQGAVIGFAIGSAVTGNIWALFVHPDHELPVMGAVCTTPWSSGCFNTGCRACG
jgi:hypothetical protein